MAPQPTHSSAKSPNDIANRLVWLASQLQRWGTQRTPTSNPYHLNFSQVSILYQIRYGITTPGALARLMMMTPRAITSHVDVLESHQLVERQGDAHDRRLVRLHLTPAGERLSRDVEDQALSPLTAYLAGLTPEDLAVINTALNLIQQGFHDINIPS